MFKTIGAVIAGAALCVGLYLGGWWLTRDATDRTTEIQNRRNATQEAWQRQVNEAMRDAALLDPGPQRQAVIRVACDLIPELTDTYRTDSIESFALENC